jgi:hypothetical protein
METSMADERGDRGGWMGKCVGEGYYFAAARCLLLAYGFWAAIVAPRHPIHRNRHICLPAIVATASPHYRHRHNSTFKLLDLGDLLAVSFLPARLAAISRRLLPSARPCHLPSPSAASVQQLLNDDNDDWTTPPLSVSNATCLVIQQHHTAPTPTTHIGAKIQDGTIKLVDDDDTYV